VCVCILQVLSVTLCAQNLIRPTLTPYISFGDDTFSNLRLSERFYLASISTIASNAKQTVSLRLHTLSAKNGHPTQQYKYTYYYNLHMLKDDLYHLDINIQAQSYYYPTTHQILR
jgi:hypothetical protein